MGKVKQAVQEVQEEIQEIVYFWKGDISLDDIKTILVFDEFTDNLNASQIELVPQTISLKVSNGFFIAEVAKGFAAK